MTGLGNKKIMSDNINYYLKIKGKERKEASKEIGVSYSTFTDGEYPLPPSQTKHRL